MQLTIDNQTFNVDIAPLQDRARQGLTDMIQSKGGKGDLLRPIVKSGCLMAMGVLGLEKKDRNDDPILIVTAHIAELIFKGLDEKGLVLTTIEPPPAPAEGTTAP